MKIYKLFTFALAGLAFAACSNDDEVTNGSIDGQTGEPTWVSFKVVEEGTIPSTRGINGDDTTADTSPAAITGGHVYVFSNNVWEKTIAFTGTETEVEQLTTGTKLFVVLANRAEVTGLTTATTLTTFREKIETGTSGQDLVTNLMEVGDQPSWLLSNSLDAYNAANATGNFEGPSREVVDALKTEVEGATKNNFTIKLNRAVARAKFDVLDAIKDGSSIKAMQGSNEVARVTDLQMQYSNQAKKVNTFLQVSAGQVSSPFYNATLNTDALIKDVIQQDGVFGALPTTYTYLPENTFNAPANGQATNIYLKGTYAPTIIVKGYESKDYAGTESIIKGTLVAGDTFAYDDLTDTYFVYATTGADYTLDGITLPSADEAERDAALNKIWVAIAKDKGIYDIVKHYGSWSQEAGATWKLTPAEGTPWPTTEELKLKENRDKINPVAAKDGSYYLGAMYKMRVFTSGEARYRIYLTDNDTDGMKGYKSVIRNYSYNVTLNGITGPGIADGETYPGGSTEQKPGGGNGSIDDPFQPGTGDGGQPEDPIDPSKSTYIKATIQIKPWVKVEQGAIVG